MQLKLKKIKKVICVIFALLLPHSDKCSNDIRYYVCVVFQNHQTYEEFVTAPYLEVFVRSFASDPDIESVFFTRDITYVPESDIN